MPPPEKLELYKRVGIGGIVRMDRDGKDREVYARGHPQLGRHGLQPGNGELWFTDNQVDGMGDDIPPGELNRITAPGQNFGFPWYGGGTVRTEEYKDSEPPADAVLAGGRDGRARGRSRHDLLHRQDVPRAVPRRHLHRPARLVEPHRRRSARG